MTDTGVDDMDTNCSNDDATPGGHRHAGRDSERWDDFASVLAELLAALPVHRFLVLTTDASAGVPGAYVQFSRVPEGIYCEAVSNVYLGAGSQLTEDQNLHLELLGWEPPGEAGNWWRGVEEELGAEEPAELAVRTLRTVYGQQTPAGLSVTPAELSIPLGAVPHDDAVDQDGPETAAARVAEVAGAHGVYRGRDADGVHTLEIDGERIRVQIQELGPLSMVHASTRVLEGDAPPDRVVRFLRAIAHRAGRYRLDTVDAGDGNSLWLTGVWIGPADATDSDDWVALCEECIEGARWARAIVETLG